MFNVVHGDKEAVDALLAHPGIAARLVRRLDADRAATSTRRARAHGKRVQALGGAKNHAVVLPDADLDLAADALVCAAYGSAGQRCMAISVAVAVGDVADPLVGKVRERIAKLHDRRRHRRRRRTWARWSPSATTRRSPGYVDAGVEEGAELVVDGRGLTVEGHEGGYFLGPSLFDHVTPGDARSTTRRSSARCSSSCAPTATRRRSSSSTPTRTATARRSSPATAARRGCSSSEATAGMVGINVPIPVPMAYHSFGGWKSSLFGDLHVHGPEGVRFYTRGKVVTTRWPDPSARRRQPGLPYADVALGERQPPLGKEAEGAGAAACDCRVSSLQGKKLDDRRLDRRMAD